jgi:hypothetical protein
MYGWCIGKEEYSGLVSPASQHLDFAHGWILHMAEFTCSRNLQQNNTTMQKGMLR